LDWLTAATSSWPFTATFEGAIATAFTASTGSPMVAEQSMVISSCMGSVVRIVDGVKLGELTHLEDEFSYAIDCVVTAIALRITDAVNP
jgi:hypothetical protein